MTSAEKRRRMNRNFGGNPDMKRSYGKRLAGSVLALLLAAGSASAEGAKMPTVASFEEAQTIAAKNHVPILIDFGAEW